MTAKAPRLFTYLIEVPFTITEYGNPARENGSVPSLDRRESGFLICARAPSAEHAVHALESELTDIMAQHNEKLAEIEENWKAFSQGTGVKRMNTNAERFEAEARNLLRDLAVTKLDPDHLAALERIVNEFWDELVGEGEMTGNEATYGFARVALDAIKRRHEQPVEGDVGRVARALAMAYDMGADDCAPYSGE